MKLKSMTFCQLFLQITAVAFSLGHPVYELFTIAYFKWSFANLMIHVILYF